jgi:site-specific DNA-cytosine methylase
MIILMREREGKSGGGKGFLLSDDKAFTLATSNFHTIFMFSHNQGLDPQASEEASPTLRSGGNGMAVAFPLDLRNATRDADKLDKQNRQGLGVGNEGDPSPTITNAFVPGVVAFDTFNQTVSDTSQTIKAHSANNETIGTVFQTSTVRRLTPTECERLQGFPDGWTDGQADSHRYKQMGNAVAVPVVQWIIDRLVK